VAGAAIAHTRRAVKATLPIGLRSAPCAPRPLSSILVFTGSHPVIGRHPRPLQRLLKKIGTFLQFLRL
jgi:hypothetical protein